MDIEKDNIRADLEKAFEEHTPAEETGRPETNAQEPVRNAEAAEKPAVEARGPEAGAEGDGGKGQQATERSDGRDEQGRFKPKDGAQPEGTQQAPTQPVVAEPLAAPPGWKAAAREHWNTIPRAAQEEISRREKETAQALNQSTLARKFHNDFNNVINPFMPMIQAQGSNPLQSVRQLMTTAAGLTIGSAEQKARIVREIIQNYGVDVGILDQVLAGSPVAPGLQRVNESNSPPQWAQPLFQFMGSVQAAQQQRQQQIYTDAQSETEAFSASHEFFEDVREDMADIMEIAANRGRIVSMEDAYKKAVAMNADIAAVVQQREAAKKSQQQVATVQKARAAASSIAGAPRNGAAGAPKETGSRRDDLEAAWDEQMGR